MPGTRSVYFDPETEAIIRNDQARTFHKFSRQVCLTIKEVNRLRKTVTQQNDEITLLKLKILELSKDKEEKD